MASNKFWLADFRGRKLPDDKAELVAERVADFVVYCTPSDISVKAQRFQSGPIVVRACSGASSLPARGIKAAAPFLCTVCRVEALACSIFDQVALRLRCAGGQQRARGI